MRILLSACCCLVAVLLQAQIPSSSVESDVGCSIVERGPHHRVVETMVLETNSVGEVTTHTNSYIELATGLHYQENGQWLESREEIELLPNDRGAAALHGAHKVIFPADIYDGQIELNTPDEKWLRSRVLGLRYYDTEGGKSMLIAETTNSIGELHGSNVVIYSEAFTDFKADVRYTYTRAGFEQDVILREQPPAPEVYGLNPKTTRLQVLTEFFDPPRPQRPNELTEPDPRTRWRM